MDSPVGRPSFAHDASPPEFLQMLSRISKYAYYLGYGCCVALFVVMMGSMLLQVFCRYVLNRPLLWPEELTIFSMIWLAFIGSSLGVKKAAHIRFTLLFYMVSERTRGYLELFAIVCLLVFTGISIPFGIDVVVTSRGTSPALGVAYLWPKLGMLIGFALIFIHATYYLFAFWSRSLTGDTAMIRRIKWFVGEDKG